MNKYNVSISIYLYQTFAIANVHVGQMCSSDLQCTGTDNSGVCCNGVCQCQLGYLKIDGFCYQGNQWRRASFIKHIIMYTNSQVTKSAGY